MKTLLVILIIKLNYSLKTCVSIYFFYITCINSIISTLQQAHETICKRFFGGSPREASSTTPGPSYPPKATGSSKSDDEETDYDNVDSYDFPGAGDPMRRGDWRAQHEELISQVRSSRRAARASTEASKSRSPPPPPPKVPGWLTIVSDL